MDTWIDSGKDREETAELPIMTEWSSLVIDTAAAGKDISYLVPYREWAKREKENEGKEKR